jgi:hypothetical protein
MAQPAPPRTAPLRQEDGPLTPRERDRARWLAHNLVHRDGLSVRQEQRAMAERYGLRRAVGTIARDLADFECPACEDRG